MRTDCVLGLDPKKDEKCLGAKCGKCGWNRNEATRRKRLLQDKGLTAGRDGKLKLKLSGRVETRPVEHDPEEILKLWNEGLTGAEICERLGCHSNTVGKVLRAAGIVRRKRRGQDGDL